MDTTRKKVVQRKAAVETDTSKCREEAIVFSVPVSQVTETKEKSEPSTSNGTPPYRSPVSSVASVTFVGEDVVAPLSKLPETAKKLYQEAKSLLEQSGNLKTTIREGVLSNLAGLYEIVLQLSESRNTLQRQMEMNKEAAEECTTGVLGEVDLSSFKESIVKAVQEVVEKTQSSEVIRLEKDIKNLQDSIDQSSKAHEKDLRELRSALTRSADAQQKIAIAQSSSNLRQAQKVGTLGERELQPRSYASVAAQPRYSVLIESADPKHTGQDILNTVKEKVDVVQLGLGVNGVRRLRNQKVAISCDTEVDRNTLKQAITGIDSKLTVSIPPIRKPLLRLIGVAHDLDDKRIEEAIPKQNAKFFADIDTKDAEIKVLRRTKGRTRDVSNVIIETNPKIWNQLRDQRLRLGYQVVPAVDQSPVLQCYKCMSFGHRAQECNSQTRCGYCAMDHDTRDCSNRGDAPKCVNCTGSDHLHPAYSPECPEWVKWDKIARSTISYC